MVHVKVSEGKAKNDLGAESTEFAGTLKKRRGKKDGNDFAGE